MGQEGSEVRCDAGWVSTIIIRSKLEQKKKGWKNRGRGILRADPEKPEFHGKQKKLSLSI